MSGTWILAADGSQAKIYQYQGPDHIPSLIKGGEFAHVNKPNRELVSDKRGRAFHSADGSRSAMAYTSDPHELEKLAFAKEVSDFLSNEESTFDRLVVAAPPKMLGYLRQVLSANVKGKIKSELNKDLVQVEPALLGKHLQHDLKFNPGLRPLTQA